MYVCGNMCIFQFGERAALDSTPRGVWVKHHITYESQHRESAENAQSHKNITFEFVPLDSSNTNPNSCTHFSMINAVAVRIIFLARDR